MKDLQGMTLQELRDEESALEDTLERVRLAIIDRTMRDLDAGTILRWGREPVGVSA